MKTVKRDKNNRAYKNGYFAGRKGHSKKYCPYNSQLEQRELWLGGWREGWIYFKTGMEEEI